MTGFDQEWDRCGPWLQAALDHAGNLFTLDDVKQAVIKGKAIFYPESMLLLLQKFVYFLRNVFLTAGSPVVI